MKRNLRKTKFYLITTILCLFALLSLPLLSSCAPKSEKYGETYIDQKMLFEFSDEILEKVHYANGLGYYNAFGINVTYAYSYSAKTSVEIYDGKALPDNVVYVSPYEDIPNAVIVSKWMYLYSLYENASFPGVYITDFNVANFILNDNYCMEKVNMDPISLKNDEKYGKGDASDYGIPLYLLRQRCLLVGKDDISPEIILSEPLCYKYCGELTCAALARYGVIDFDLRKGAVGRLNIYASSDGYNTAQTLNVVGYYETEADKLLGSGVSMDENSDEYKTVIAQLEKPIFYALNGNPLAD